MNKRVAVIRIRGEAGLSKEVKDTMKMLRLYKKNMCVVVSNTSQNIGMLTKVKDYITWGEIDQDTFKVLLTKRGRIMGNNILTEEYLKNKLGMDYDTFIKDYFDFKKELKDIPGFKLFFRLSPPRGGFERKGVKVPFSLGGTSGYRKDKINDLIKRMV